VNSKLADRSALARAKRVAPLGGRVCADSCVCATCRFVSGGEWKLNVCGWRATLSALACSAPTASGCAAIAAAAVPSVDSGAGIAAAALPDPAPLTSALICGALRWGLKEGSEVKAEDRVGPDSQQYGR
jgi:hypothetical protein